VSKASQEADQALSRHLMDRRKKQHGGLSYDALQAHAKAVQIKGRKRAQREGKRP
jgi:hypothetical protein